MASKLGDGVPASAVHRLTSLEIARASQVLARAFRNDPLVAYFLPHAAGRERCLNRFYRCFLRYGLRYGEVQATSPGLEGLAMWLPPEEIHVAVLKMVRVGAFRLPFTVGPRFLVRSWRYSEHIGRLCRRHAPFPHWYLQLLAVDPEHQRQGWATRLLRSMLERLDHRKTPCCLDTANRANLAFYERLGFRTAAESRVPGENVDCWLMVRGA
ncbi:MAG: GNAT family N-acetyltransferase [Thermoguttaceae bacterium]